MAVLFGVGLSPPCSAEPNSVVNYLIRQEVSLFSFGVFRLDAEVRSLASDHPAYFSADYDWDANRIRLHALSLAGSMGPTQENCRKLIRAMRSRGRIDPDTGNPIIATMKNSSYANLFEPIGFSLKNAPEERLQKIDQIIELHADIYSEDGQHVACHGPLRSTDVLFEDPR
jgi:hypothetical protein